MRLATTALSGALALASTWQYAHAARSYDACTGYIESLPATISSPGTWCLRRDLSTALSSGPAITVAANNVTLDCNDFKLGGLPAGMATRATGIFADARSNTTVRNCAIRGFYMGMRLSGSGHLVEDNRFDGNTYRGIWALGNGGTIRRNRILDTGGATGTTSAIALETQGAVDIIDNTITGVAASDEYTSTFARAVRAIQADGSVIAGNRIRDVVAKNNAADGIFVSRWVAASIYYDAVTWQQAHDACAATEGTLAVVDNAEEAAYYGSLGADFWIGGSDAAQEGTWRWLTGAALTYANWGADQPDDAGGAQDYLAIKTDGTWADEDGSSLLSYICEYDDKRAPVVVRGNTIVGNGAELSYGIRGSCLSRDNVLSGVDTTGSQFCTDGGGNQITP
jgi:parallel beta-helix repeat protein